MDDLEFDLLIKKINSDICPKELLLQDKKLNINQIKKLSDC